MSYTSNNSNNDYSVDPEDILSGCKLGPWVFRKNGHHVLGRGVSEILGL
jgi:hypothetical protein